LTQEGAAVHARLDGRLVLVGFGGVGQGVLPLLLRHLALDPSRITIFTAHEGGESFARSLGVADLRRVPLTRANYRDELLPLLDPGGFLLNLAFDVSSVALIGLCRERDVPYLDSCIEPWAGGYTDLRLSASQRSNYGLREEALALRETPGHRPTCVLTQGINPGLVSQLIKPALLRMAADTGLRREEPVTRLGWARLARDLGIRAIHVAERDFQHALRPKAPGEFVNTWSTEAFVGEGSQPAELGWGSHEGELPPLGKRHAQGSGAAIYLERPGVSVRVRSWTPLEGAFHGFLITHAESISLADYLSIVEDGGVQYRPTVHYAYRPCDDAVLSIHEYCGRGYRLQERHRLLRDEIVAGLDEVGVLLCGNGRGVYWYGSRLDIGEARRLAPGNNATTLQTAAGVLAGVAWALNNPGRGIVEPEDIDPKAALAVAGQYLGEILGQWGDWDPLQDRGRLFPEPVDPSDPWRFANVLVT